MQRVLRPGGRIGISDVVADNDLDPASIVERASRIGCLAGALTFDEYQQQLADAGFAEITLISTHDYGDGIHSVIVQAAVADT